MNILFLTTHLNTGGITSYILSLGSGLYKQGHKVFVASSGGDLCGVFAERGINCVHIPINTKSEINLPKLARSFFILRRLIKEHGIDVIHSHSRVTQVLGNMAGGAFGIPYVSTCHGFFKNKISRRLFPCWGKRVIAISESVREHLKNDFCVQESRIRLIYNGIDARRFSRCAALSREERMKKKRILGLQDGPLVGIVGRLSDVKGHRYLIEAMSVVIKKIPAAQLLIVGEGKTEEELKTLTGSLGLQKNVFFLPSTRDTTEVLAGMDLFVMPSLREGLGLSLMEAMACGLPVIGSDIGGIRDLIRSGKNGILVKTADSAALAGAILELLSDRARANALGSNAKSFITCEFPLEKMVSQTEAVYAECMTERKNSRWYWKK